MKYMHCIRLLTVLTCLVVCLAVFPASVSAAGNAVVTVSVPGGSLQPGEQFTISIQVDPNNDIAGMQFNLSFNSGLVAVNSITEGGLLAQNGDSTYFSSGNINNTSGTISGVFGAILSPGQSVSTSGAFATITATAGGSAGTCQFSLSNVIVGDIASQSIPVTLVNQSIVIAEDDSPEDPADEGPSGGVVGGGSGGGGGSTATDDKRFTNISGSSNLDGTLWEDIAVLSVDIKLELIIPRGTMVLNANGYPPNSLTVATLAETGSPPNESGYVGNVYNLTPEGTTFDPYAILKIYYDENDIPAGMSEESLLINNRQAYSSTWEELSSEIDTEANCITAIITHFSDYTICVGARPAELSVTQMSVTPGEIARGDQVTVTATVTNSGDIAGVYEAGLEVDGNIIATKSITVSPGSSQVVSFTFSPDAAGQYTIRIGGQQRTITVGEPLAPAAFSVTGLSVTPLRPVIGEPVTIDVEVQNAGDSAGSYSVAVIVDGIAQPAREITLEGVTGGTVTFTFTAETAGMHSVAIGEFIAPFETVAAQVIPQVDETAAPEVSSFSLQPVYDEQTSRLVSSHIIYRMNRDWASLDSQLFLNIFRDNHLIDQLPLLDLGQLQDDGVTGVLDYVPQAGWEAGQYSFSVELYSGDELLQNSVQQMTVTPELGADVVSWKTMGIIIGIAFAIGLIIVGVVLYHRRDMLRDYK